MIKVIGAILIISASTWIGFEVSRHLTERPRQLRYLRTALKSLEAEIMYGHIPLDEAALNLSRQMPKPLSLFFDTFSKKLRTGETLVRQAWEDSMKEVWKLTAFKQGEYEILKQFGETLGQSDRISQQKHILLALTQLEQEEIEARDKQTKYERMIKSLGFLSGLLLIILLM
ncbi:stage III sporulation protein SpoIIIAB [Bacillus sp. PS06]|uniref:stage III sporulation protein SpoIIIAB n=1 Tax=Bacillus sp. PS06 TaxID=2764176 RepID=UPI001786D86E|nr:stage III sporulation protein SpoIIIAB [Bacillus sp. PS06]MBD8070409.1 stage III sporulation protein SpoAB [Bacillus sp. PS06]